MKVVSGLSIPLVYIYINLILIHSFGVPFFIFNISLQFYNVTVLSEKFSQILKEEELTMSSIKRTSVGCRKQTYGYQEGKGGRGINWEIGIDIYTLLYIKQITNKDLLYNTRNSTQHSVMIYMGKESKKEYIYVYV